MTILDEIIETISQRDTNSNTIYKEVIVSPDTARKLHHDDRVYKLNNRKGDLMAAGVVFIPRNTAKALSNNYYLKSPDCSLCGSETLLNQHTGEYYCPAHYNE